MLEEDAIRFDTFLKENDKKAHEAIKKAERETKVMYENGRGFSLSLSFLDTDTELLFLLLCRAAPPARYFSSLLTTCWH